MLHSTAVEARAPLGPVIPLLDAANSLLPLIEYRRCVADADFEEAARLRFKAYRATGMIEDRPESTLKDANDDLPNSYTYGVWIEERIVGTVRFHHLTPAMPSAPSMDMFPEVLGPRLAMGHSFIDPSRFAVDPEIAGKIKALPYIVLRTAIAAADHLGCDACLGLVQGHHTAFYRRMFNARLLAGPKPIPPLTVQAQLYEIPRTNLEFVSRKFPFLATTRREAARMLGIDLGDGLA